MADAKISVLPAVGVPAVGDEFACNQGGVTKKETKAQITAVTDAALAAHIAVTAAAIHGSSVATAVDRLVHRSPAGDADATAFNAAAGAAGAPAHTFTGDLDTGHYNHAPNELGVATGGVHRAHWNTTGAVILNNAAASTFMTGPGVTIQQGAYDDEAGAVKSTDVAHGMTTDADTDTYAQFRKAEAAAGGLHIRGLKDADGIAGIALYLEGFLGENADTTKTTAGRAIVEIFGAIKSGTTIGDVNADGNASAVRTRRGGANVALLIVDEDADLHVLNDIVVAGVVDTIDVANHTHTGAAGMGPQIPTGGIVNNAMDNTKIRDSVGTSVIGKFNAGAGDPADIVAGGDDRLLAQTAGTVAFQQLTVGMVPAGILTATEIANRTRKFLLQPLNNAETYSQEGLSLPDTISTSVFGYFRVPDDFVGGLVVESVVITPAITKNIYNTLNARYGAYGENWNIHNDTFALQAEAMVANEHNALTSLALVAESIGDIVHLVYTRVAGNVLDTLDTIAYFVGWEISYTADS